MVRSWVGRGARDGRFGWLGGAALLAAGPSAWAQVPQVMSGAPVQMQPYVSEPGVPTVSVDVGTPNPFGGLDGGVGGTGAGGVDGSAGGGGGGGGGDALSTMLSTSWGSAAVADAQALGVNPAVLAGTCAAESQCQNIPNATGGSATGPFQMLPSTFEQMYAAALKDNPDLATSTTDNVNDPASEAAAAAEMMKQEAEILESKGISNPTLLDVRGGYMTPQYGVALAKADDSTTLGSVLTSWSSSTYANNGMSPTETVGQWRASQTSRLGSAASQSVFQ